MQHLSARLVPARRPWWAETTQSSAPCASSRVGRLGRRTETSGRGLTAEGAHDPTPFSLIASRCIRRCSPHRPFETTHRHSERRLVLEVEVARAEAAHHDGRHADAAVEVAAAMGVEARRR